MKLLFFVLSFSVAAIGFAQSDKYQTAMTTAIAAMDSAKTTAEKQSAAVNFEHIGNEEKNQWLPFYYAGLCYATIGWTDTSIDKDANAKKVLDLCDKAEAIEKNSEIYVLRNMATLQQLLVDPQSRFRTYGMMASQALSTAKELDPKNPRIYYMEGMSVLGTPEQFGGGKSAAKPILEKAVALFKEEKPKPLYPHWGQQKAEAALAQCR
ncbi:hypothetical protein A8C56_04130 [Niabella ginsenosidivorans]|uniref:Tetratricopeptide repeat protein n=1 Tax=Niabella ginsenosidivorans TaxID=1176587 RepID=A0A1A9HZN9_9BACT|nr:hypothetical protein [Niabella ginsenosidivorans]ANH80279.1 hypothetical protein A8C56_04130 [Niabella ginsenosidivorans]